MTFEKFCEDDKTVNAVIRNFEIIGEAAGHIPLEIQEKYPESDQGKASQADLTFSRVRGGISFTIASMVDVVIFSPVLEVLDQYVPDCNAYLWWPFTTLP
jgi:hypothetical protein